MPIQCRCPRGHALTVPRRRAGTQVRCPICSSVTQVPPIEEEIEAPPVAAPPAASKPAPSPPPAAAKSPAPPPSPRKEPARSPPPRPPEKNSSSTKSLPPPLRSSEPTAKVPGPNAEAPSLPPALKPSPPKPAEAPGKDSGERGFSAPPSSQPPTPSKKPVEKTVVEKPVADTPPAERPKPETKAGRKEPDRREEKKISAKVSPPELPAGKVAASKQVDEKANAPKKSAAERKEEPKVAAEKDPERKAAAPPPPVEPVKETKKAKSEPAPAPPVPKSETSTKPVPAETPVAPTVPIVATRSPFPEPPALPKSEKLAAPAPSEPAEPEGAVLPPPLPSDSAEDLPGIEHHAEELGPVYTIALSLGALAIFSLGPVGLEFVSWYQAATTMEDTAGLGFWVWLVLLAAVLQMGYAVYLAQLPDWSSLWVVTLTALVVASGYACGLALMMLGAKDAQLIEQLGLAFLRENRSGAASLWCLCLMSLGFMLSYFSGMLSWQWSRRSLALIAAKAKGKE